MKRASRRRNLVDANCEVCSNVYYLSGLIPDRARRRAYRRLAHVITSTYLHLRVRRLITSSADGWFVNEDRAQDSRVIRVRRGFNQTTLQTGAESIVTLCKCPRKLLNRFIKADCRVSSDHEATTCYRFAVTRIYSCRAVPLIIR